MTVFHHSVTTSFTHAPKSIDLQRLGRILSVEDWHTSAIKLLSLTCYKSPPLSNSIGQAPATLWPHHGVNGSRKWMNGSMVFSISISTIPGQGHRVAGAYPCSYYMKGCHCFPVFASGTKCNANLLYVFFFPKEKNCKNATKFYLLFLSL